MASGTDSTIFCDVDDTIVRERTLVGFLEMLPERAYVLPDLLGLIRRGVPRGDVNRIYYQKVLAGLSCEAVQDIVDQWYFRKEQDATFFKVGVLAYIGSLRTFGTRVVLVSGSFGALLRPIAARVSAEAVLGADLEVCDGHYTGRLRSPPTIGEGKAIAIRRYAEQTGIDLQNCAGLGDDLTDVPFLELVGHQAVPSDASPDMLEQARQRHWHVVPA